MNKTINFSKYLFPVYFQKLHAFIFGEHNPFKSYSWVLYPKIDGPRRMVTELHENFSHPAALSYFDTILFEEIISYHFFKKDTKTANYLLNLYRPLLEGAVLASVATNIKDYFPTYFTSIEDVHVKTVCYELLRMRDNILSLHRNEDKISNLPAPLSIYIDTLRTSYVHPASKFGEPNQSFMCFDIEYLVKLPINLSYFIDTHRDYIVAMRIINEDLEASLNGKRNASKKKNMLYGKSFRVAASHDGIKMAFLLALCNKLTTEESPDAMGYLLSHLFCIFRQYMVFWYKSATGNIDFLYAAKDILATVKDTSRNIALISENTTFDKDNLVDGFYFKTITKHLMYKLSERLTKSGTGRKYTAKEYVDLLCDVVAYGIQLIFLLYQDYCHGNFQSKYFEVLFKDLTYHEDSSEDINKSAFRELFYESKIFLMSYSKTLFENSLKDCVDKYLHGADEIEDNIIKTNQNNLQQMFTLPSKKKEKLFAYIVHEESDSIIQSLLKKAIL